MFEHALSMAPPEESKPLYLEVWAVWAGRSASLHMLASLSVCTRVHVCACAVAPVGVRISYLGVGSWRASVCHKGMPAPAPAGFQAPLASYLSVCEPALCWRVRTSPCWGLVQALPSSGEHTDPFCPYAHKRCCTAHAASRALKPETHSGVDFVHLEKVHTRSVLELGVHAKFVCVSHVHAAHHLRHACTHVRSMRFWRSATAWPNTAWKCMSAHQRPCPRPSACPSTISTLPRPPSSLA